MVTAAGRAVAWAVILAKFEHLSGVNVISRLLLCEQSLGR